jgi:chemotaxis protein MotB
MKLFKAIIFLFLLAGLTGCVTTEMSRKLTGLEAENKSLKQANMDLGIATTELESRIERLEEAKRACTREIEASRTRAETCALRVETLEEEKDALQQQIDALRSGSSSEIRKLLEELQGTHDELTAREDRLKVAHEELEARNSRLIELEKILQQKEQAVNELKTKVADALTGFHDNGLSVYEKNGKVYVSLEERLLFKTGKWEVDPNGQKALQNLADVLAQNTDINIMVEGHTDNVPMHGSGEVQDNWDLSVLRATSVTKILTRNSRVDPARIIAAGRSEYIPLEENDTPENRQKNRRTEIILTPKLDELLQIIEMN